MWGLFGLITIKAAPTLLFSLLPSVNICKCSGCSPANELYSSSFDMTANVILILRAGCSSFLSPTGVSIGRSAGICLDLPVSLVASLSAVSASLFGSGINCASVMAVDVRMVLNPWIIFIANNLWMDSNKLSTCLNVSALWAHIPAAYEMMGCMTWMYIVLILAEMRPQVGRTKIANL